NSAGGTVNDSIAKANATITVTPYSVAYDGGAHTATGTATGVQGEGLSTLLDLDGTTHTSAGTYTGDAWTFAGNANYNSAAGTADTATGSATGVQGEKLSSLLDLSGTTHTLAGTYNGDAWTFAGNTNYNSAGGTVDDAIAKATASVSLGNLSQTYNGSARTV